jgi:hypothetical protein
MFVSKPGQLHQVVGACASLAVARVLAVVVDVLLRSAVRRVHHRVATSALAHPKVELQVRVATCK